ncbi:MAG: ABC transporter ATP-binding protein [Candidatus Methanoculleus thermohydrogenotrophicum]|jgi:ABC-type lipoprotein export system ATPase subunit|nr:ABC transporter ATP-binding protein [Candidatus Methanoculleus thermohydrogenotrophicum]HPZ37768.1 ABC transporter ATP-binding protein [Candidatus Methanoculleus thermohydrogenotrophicum]HQC91637.1 ABC transporter ATP-binding protein [Candidatus Methanoculleus thermohydrogenotrophicum]
MTAGIRTESLTKRFENGVTALRDVSITIAPGEFVALIGRSGSGKSTLMNILGGLDAPTSGSVYFDDERIEYTDRKRLIHLRRNEVGFVFQQFNLVPTISAIENVAYPLLFNYTPREERDQRALRLLTLVGLADRADHLPHELSGGEQQRVAIARALVGSPHIVLADEPTGNLDSKNSAEIYRLMRTINQEHEVTFLVVTHERELASYCDRTIELRDGRVVA